MVSDGWASPRPLPLSQAKLHPGGNFGTQIGQAGVKQHHLVWSPVNSTLRSVFPAVHAYNQARDAMHNPRTLTLAL